MEGVAEGRLLLMIFFRFFFSVSFRVLREPPNRRPWRRREKKRGRARSTSLFASRSPRFPFALLWLLSPSSRREKHRKGDRGQTGGGNGAKNDSAGNQSMVDRYEQRRTSLSLSLPPFPPPLSPMERKKVASQGATRPFFRSNNPEEPSSLSHWVALASWRGRKREEQAEARRAKGRERDRITQHRRQSSVERRTKTTEKKH